MLDNKKDINSNEKGEIIMNATVKEDRYCSIQASIKQSCKEVQLMRKGRLPKNSLKDLFADIEKWVNEDDDK